MAGKQFIAVDLGATSGRVMRGALENGKLQLEEMHRFPNGPVEESGHLHWDVPVLYGNVIIGLSRTAAAGYTEPQALSGWVRPWVSPERPAASLPWSSPR